MHFLTQSLRHIYIYTVKNEDITHSMQDYFVLNKHRINLISVIIMTSSTKSWFCTNIYSYSI